MANQSEQSFDNHSRIVFGYHVVTFLLILINFVYAAYTLFTDPSISTMIATTTGTALLLLFYYSRAFGLGNQDRIIRIEETLRFERILTDELRNRAKALTTKQLIALRFASDEELEQLVGKILSENIADPKDIKRLIHRWRPDHARI